MELKPTDTSLRFDIAYKHSEDLTPSLSFYHYRKAILINPDQGALNNAGIEAAALDLPLTSVEHYERSEKMGSTIAMANIAARLIDAGFSDYAKQILGRARRQENYHENVDINFARIHEIKNKEEEKIKELEKKTEFLIRWRTLEAEAIIQESFPVDQLVGTYETDINSELKFKIGDRSDIIGEMETSNEKFSLNGHVEGRLVFYKWSSTPLTTNPQPLGGLSLMRSPSFPSSGKGIFIIKDGGKILRGYKTIEKVPLSLIEWTLKRKS